MGYWLQYPDLTFDEDKHLYLWRKRPVKSVTQVLSSVGTRDKNNNWSPLGFDDRWIRDTTAADFGTAFHKIAAIILKGSTPTYPPVMEPWVQQFCRFKKEYKPVPLVDKGGNLVLEYPMVSEKFGYAGTPDLVCEMGKDIYLLDWKTSTADSMHWGIQLAAYEKLIKEVLGIKKKIHRMTVRFGELSYHVKRWVSPSDWAMFQSCLNINKLAKG